MAEKITTINGAKTVLLISEAIAVTAALCTAGFGLLAFVEHIYDKARGVQPTSINNFTPTPLPETQIHILPKISPTPIIFTELRCEEYDPAKGQDIKNIWKTLGEPDTLYIPAPDGSIIIMNPSGGYTIQPRLGVDVCK